MKVRVKFSKYGVMKFIGHLDIMRYFQKAMRRAEIPAAYSQGFSPHMIMSFANPLGVGLTSDGEYFDIELEESISSEIAIGRLNAVKRWATSRQFCSEARVDCLSSLNSR